jgi:hypothetical protein
VCLDFHKNTRIVQTASVQQVREPIYKSSKERWKRYGKNIGDFAVNLGTYLSDTDIDYLHDIGIHVNQKKWWRIF